jgi:hypothetical protein
MNAEDILGKKVIGFKFEGGPGWNSSMDKHIGKIGTIKKQSKSWCVVVFSSGERWSFPYPEILEHLVEKEEEELTIEQILNNMKKLISQI